MKGRTERTRRKKLIEGLIIFLLILIVCVWAWWKLNKQDVKDIIAFYQPFSEEDVRYENGDLYVDAQLLLTTDDTLSYSDIEKLLSGYGGEPVGYVSITNDYQVSFPGQTTHEELNNFIQEIGEIEGIDEVTFNYVYEIDGAAIDYKQDPWIPASDPKNTSGSEWSEAEPKGTNWWAEAVRLPSVWDMSIWDDPNNYSEINIGIIDTMFDITNQDLEDVFEKVWLNPEDTDGNYTVTELYKQAKKEEKLNLLHGTHVAGIIGAKAGNNFGITGSASCVSPRLFGYAVQGERNQYYTDSMMWKHAIAVMLKEDVKVINISLGFESMLYAAFQGNSQALLELKRYSGSMERYLKKCLEQKYEFLLVASAGNTAGYGWKECAPSKEHPYGYKEIPGGTSKPCDSRYDVLGAITNKKVKDHIIIVGATEKSWVSNFLKPSYNIAQFSNIGADVYAPGVKILSTIPGNEVDYQNGTSMASPIVAGTAALMWSVNPELSAGQIKEILISSMNSNDLGAGEITNINAYRAVRSASTIKGSGNEEYETEGCIMGTVYTAIKDPETSKYEGKELFEIMVGVYDQNGQLIKEVKTDIYGGFDFFLPAGTYSVHIQGKGYVTYDTEIQLDKSDVEYLSVYLPPVYEWSVEPTIEADQIFYLKNADSGSYSYNELQCQFMSSYAVVEKDGQYGLIDMEGEYLVEAKYKKMSLHGTSYYVDGGSADKSYYVTKKGNIIPGTEPALAAGIVEEPKAFYYCERLHHMLESELYLSEPIDSPSVPIPLQRTESVANYKGNNGELWKWWDEIEGKYAVYSKGELVTDFIYEECGAYSSGIAAVCKDGKWGYINEQGEKILSLIYDSTWKRYTDKDSNRITTADAKEEYCYAASGGYIVLCEKGKWGLRDIEGNEVIPAGDFEQICPVYEDKCWVKSGGKWGVIQINDSINEKDSRMQEQIIGSWVSEEKTGEIFPAIVFKDDGTVDFGGKSAEFYNAPYWFEGEKLYINILEAEEDTVCFEFKYLEGENKQISISALQAETENVLDIMRNNVDGIYIKNETLVSSDTYQKIYGPIVEDVCQLYGENNVYHCYDIDKDGVKELIIQEGTDYGTYVYKIYTIKDNQSIYLGSISGFHCSLYKDENGGTEPYIIRSEGLNQHAVVSHIKIQDGAVEEEIISETNGEGYYSNPYELGMSTVNSLLLLENEWYES